MTMHPSCDRILKGGDTMLRRKNLRPCMLLACMALLCSCNTEEDIANLGGETTASSQTLPSDSSPEGYDHFIDNCKYDHYSAEEYQAHVLKDGRKPVSEVKEEYTSLIERMMSDPQNCFTFENTEVMPFPDISQVSAVVAKANSITCEDAWSIIEYWLDKWGLSDAVDMDTAVLDTKISKDRGEGEIPYALAKDVWSETTGDGFMILDTQHCYIQIVGSGIGILSHGVITDYVGSKRGEKISRTLDPYDAFGEVEKSGRLYELKDEAYELIDSSSITVGEAADIVYSFYASCNSEDQEIYSVDVVCAEDRYYYRFNTRQVFRGVPLTVHEPGHITEYVKKYYMGGELGKVYVAGKDEVCAFCGSTGQSTAEDLIEPQDMMLGPEEAMHIVYGIMSEDYRCNIDRIELCMACYSTPNDPDRPGTFMPTCWEFTGHSDVSGKTIKIDVDVLTGEVGFIEFGRGNE